MKSLFRLFLLAIVLSGAGIPAAKADVTLPDLFSDHMLLQADVAVPVWGWAAPGETVTVALAGQTKNAVADAKGKWMLKLDKLKSGESGTMTVKGKNTITINDVLVGEVWLCSGQSNMAGLVGNQERATAALPNLRQFREESPGAGEPQDKCKGTWIVCDPKTVAKFSGAGYFFGKNLHEKIKQPVGLLFSAVGGTQIELWTPASKPKSKEGSLFNGKIAPLIPYALRGAIWYQGESNARTAEQGLQYASQLKTLIEAWRTRWGQGDFPVAWVQLPNFRNDTFLGWCEVRESMLKTLSLPNTGMAVTIDYTGDAKNIHPGNKPVVGLRLALWALAKVYGQDIPFSGPLNTGHEVKGSEIVLSFKYADGGLKAKEGALKGFVLAGKDRKWEPASARIEGDKIIVSSKAVTQPIAVRYAWEDDPKCNLINGAGLPASPFRTDDWPAPPVEPTKKP